MNTDDLEKIQALVESSRQELLVALDAYDNEIEAATITYLEEFLKPEPKRSEVARELATEALQLIRRFATQKASIASDAAILGLNMNSAVSAITIALMSETIGNLGNSPPTGGSPLETLLAHAKQLKESREQFERSGKIAFQNAYEIGATVVKIQELAATVLPMRTTTMHAFWVEHLDQSVTIGLLVERLGKILKEKEIPVPDPTYELFKFLKSMGHNLAKLLGKKKLPTDPGGQDQMLGLLGILRKESAALESLATDYSNARSELDRIAANPLKLPA